MKADDFQKQQKLTRCYSRHKALKIGDYAIYGGSASNPIVRDADIYVSLQSGSTSNLICDPWDRQVVEVHYSIADGECPRDLTRFKKMITWLSDQLQAGKKIHVGCIGGHGRTGLVLAALLAQVTGKKDAISFVRKHYCEKAVESKMQVKFLMDHFGVTEEAASKGL